ncbi:MAG: multicopper oxidase domain-containing protein [Aquiluna sp.]
MRKALTISGSLLAVGLVVVVTTNFIPSLFDQSAGNRTALAIPPLAESQLVEGTRVFDLSLQTGETEILQGTTTPTWGVNAGYLAPTIRAAEGETVQFNVSNGLPEDTTMHWHGLHVPAMMDGGPHQPIHVGQTWSPSWLVDQAASTNWYHPHLHGRSEAHVKNGLVGMFIVDDASEAQSELPKAYGVDDIPLIIHDSPEELTTQGPIRAFFDRILGNREGDAITLVNGSPEPEFTVKTELVRFRLLNGSIGDVFNLSFSDNREFSVIASEGGLFGAPVKVEEIQMSPGERYEIVVVFKPGDDVALMKSIVDEGAEDSPVTALLHLGTESALQSSQGLPVEFGALPLVDLDSVSRVRTFEMSGVEINGLMMNMDRIDQVVHAGSSEIWSVTNIDRFEFHNFHVHGVSFRILEIGGEQPADYLASDKDTVFIPPNTEVKLFVTFPDSASDGWPFMFHCHFLRHEGRGMMGQYLVVEANQSLNPADHKIASGMSH